MTKLAKLAISKDRKTVIVLKHDKGEKAPEGYIVLGLVAYVHATKALPEMLWEAFALKPEDITVYMGLEEAQAAQNTEKATEEKVAEPVAESNEPVSEEGTETE